MPMTDSRGRRRASAIVLMVSAAVCLALMVVAGRQSPLLLAVLFCGWVVLPFLGLALCDRAADRLVQRTGADAAITTLSIASVLFYALIAVRPLGGAMAAPYLLAPAVAWLLVGVIAVWIRSARRRAQSPEPKAQSPEPKAQSPEPKAQRLSS